MGRGNNIEFKKSANSKKNNEVINSNQYAFKKQLSNREKAKGMLIKKYNISEIEAEKIIKKMELKNTSKQINVSNYRNVQNEKNTLSPNRSKQRNYLQAPKVKNFNDKSKNYEKDNVKIPFNKKDKQVKRTTFQNVSPNNISDYPQIMHSKRIPSKNMVHKSFEGGIIKPSVESTSSTRENSSNLKNNLVTEGNSFKNDSYVDESYKEKISNDLSIIELDEKKSNGVNSKNLNNESENNVDYILSNIIPDYNKQISIEVNNVNLTFDLDYEKIDNLKELVIRTIKRNKPKSNKLHVLKDISFKIYKGEKIGIIGYNGAGKSTLLKVICGIYPPDTGFVKTNGIITPLLSLGSGFDFNYSGRKNIFFNGAVLGYDKEFLESKVDEIIEFSELGKYIDVPVKNYSSGMVAKLAFSIASMLDPDILIVDEVLGVGDVTFVKKSVDKMKSLMGGGTTVLFVTHSIPQVREICDKAIWIDDGEIREIGEVNKVCDHYLKAAEKASNEQLANIKLHEG